MLSLALFWTFCNIGRYVTLGLLLHWAFCCIERFVIGRFVFGRYVSTPNYTLRHKCQQFYVSDKIINNSTDNKVLLLQ